MDDRVAEPSPALASLLSSKFALPVAPAAVMSRPRLTERLIGVDGPAVVSIVAPAGYGKTTLLRQWADLLPHVAYVALDDRDDDPTALISYIATALDRVEPMDPAALRSFASPGRSVESTLMPWLAEAIWSRQTPTVLMLDDLHRLSELAAFDVIAFLMLHLPPTLRLTLAARRLPPLPFARLRADGHLLELGAQDLALDHAEAHAMAAAIGVSLSSDEVAVLLARTEGWPVATYLGFRSVGKRKALGQGAEEELLGTESSIADYMRSELLDPLDPETQRWLRRSSVLETMSGPLCDAALATSGSLAILRKLDRDNVFVVALDSHRAAYRYHRMFRDLLLDELDEYEPGAASEARVRAATWCAEHKEREQAVEYAHASGDMDLVGRLVLGSLFPLHWSGRIVTLSRWLEWFDHDGERNRRAGLAVTAGWVHAMDGRVRDARRWLASAERSPDRSPMPDGASKEAWIALLRGFMAPAGVHTLRADARVGLAGIPDESPFRQTALILGGFAEIAAGSLDTAERFMSEAEEISEARRAYPGLALALGERALIAFARGDSQAGDGHLARGLAVIRDAAMEDHVASAALHAAAVRASLADGSSTDVRMAIARVNRMRPRVTASIPVVALQMRFETIRASIRLRDASAARTLLLETRDILRECPDLGALVGRSCRVGARPWSPCVPRHRPARGR